jgi:hypothetical protein
MKTLRRATVVLLCISVISLSCCVSTSRIANPIRIEIIEYGVYTSQPVDIIKAPEASTGTARTAKDFKLLETTGKIPISKSTQFGITMMYEDPRYKSIEVTSKILHPEMNDPYLKKTTTVSTLKKTIRSGVPAHFLYLLEEDFEMVGGSWTFEIWHKNELNCSKTFILF